jgi:hypothetical protein
MTEVASVPELHALTEGRWVARCQFCKVDGTPVAAVDATHAWEDMEKLGWSSYQPVPGAVVASLCKACGEKNRRIMGEGAKAKRGRKRK